VPDIDIANLKSLLDESKIFYQRVRSTLLSLSSRGKKSEFTKEQLADITFFMREMRGQFEEIRKDVDANGGLLGRLFCVMMLQRTLMDPEKDDIVRTEYCSAKPHYKKSLTLPKRDTIEYAQMMDYFGITEDGRDLGVAKISWKKVCDHITELAELGKPIPDFIPKIFDDYTVIHRRK
jgi:hypothetical protein